MVRERELKESELWAGLIDDDDDDDDDDEIWNVQLWRPD